MPTQLFLGNAIIQDGVDSFDCWRSRKEPIDVLNFTLKPQVSIKVENKAPTTLLLGLSGGILKPVFGGTIDRMVSPYRARDRMADMMQPVKQAFTNILPQEVLGYALKLKGIEKAELSPKQFPRKNFVADAPTFYDLILQVNRTWGVNYDGYFDVEQTFHWHERKEQSKLPVFAYGENIINLEFDGTAGTLLTVLVPEIEHSQLIGIEHPDVEVQEVLVDTVHHYTNDNGGLRTEIFFSVP